MKGKDTRISAEPFFSQSLREIFQPGFNGKIKITVWLIRINFSNAIVIAMKILKSKLD